MTTAEFISKYWPYAVLTHITSGVPASITLAQGILESNSGNSGLAQYNNFFGIKAYSNPHNVPVVYFDDDLPHEPFRSYDTAYGGFKDHADFLNTNPRYKQALDSTNYVDFATELKKAGYATAPYYATQLTSIIDNNKLYKYDFIGNNRYLFGFLVVLILVAVFILIRKQLKKKKV